MKIGDIMMYSKLNLRLTILDLFTYENVEYAEVTPAEFSSISREVPVSCLEKIA